MNGKNPRGCRLKTRIGADLLRAEKRGTLKRRKENPLTFDSRSRREKNKG